MTPNTQASWDEDSDRGAGPANVVSRGQGKDATFRVPDRHTQPSERRYVLRTLLKSELTARALAKKRQEQGDLVVFNHISSSVFNSLPQDNETSCEMQR